MRESARLMRQEDSKIPAGEDIISDSMKNTGVPLTLQNYLDLAWTDRDFEKDPLDAEERAMIPKSIKQD